MKKIIAVLMVVIGLSFVSSVYSQAPILQPDSPVRQPFQYVQDTGPVQLTIPTVMEMPVNSMYEKDYLVVEENSVPQPLAITQKMIKTPFTITSSTATAEAALSDNNTKTYVDFPLDATRIDQDTESSVTLMLNYEQPITTQALQYQLDQNAQVPDFITIKATVNNQTIVLLNKQKWFTTVTFPQVTSSSHFEVEFYYSQPLRISELYFEQQNAPTTPYLRFLARPNLTYQIYSEPVGTVPYITLPEGGDLANVAVVRSINPSVNANPYFKKPDSDNDGIIDSDDNCPYEPNKDQLDKNSNNRGDACEDFDNDGIMNAKDNCQDVPNRYQQDADGDGIGDHCDGKESRWIEQMPFLPWVGIAVGFGVVIVLFKFTLDKTEAKDKEIL